MPDRNPHLCSKTQLWDGIDQLEDCAMEGDIVRSAEPPNTRERLLMQSIARVYLLPS